LKTWELEKKDLAGKSKCEKTNEGRYKSGGGWDSWGGGWVRKVIKKKKKKERPMNELEMPNQQMKTDVYKGRCGGGHWVQRAKKKEGERGEKKLKKAKRQKFLPAEEDVGRGKVTKTKKGK